VAGLLINLPRGRPANPVKNGTTVDQAKSISGCTGERLTMKKASGKLGSKPSTIDPDSFVDELNESQQLQERLRAIVRELKATVKMLEQNLQEARSSAQSRREAKKASGGKINLTKAGNEPVDGKPNYRAGEQ
jgi:transposase